MMRRSVFAILLTTAAVASGGEWAVLSNGFQLRIERHERSGDIIRLVTGQGVTELPAAQVVAFEPDVRIPEPIAPAAPTPAPVVEPISPKQLVQDAALRHGLPPAFVHSVAQVESAYDPAARSPKGAVGLMQLMPATASALEADPADPRQNADAGARHLRDLLLKYKDHPDQVHRALAAYNAGSGAVDKYNGIPPYRETQLYVEKVLQKYRKTAGR
jgi:soluble lytic murein transglycosylase-like protein